MRVKQLCDYLIVGVSTDELALKEKGKLPVIPFAERVQIVQAIRYVDEVCPQLDKDKLRAYLTMENKFHKMFVGSDWKGSEAWTLYEKQFQAYGVEIIYLPHTDHISSTLLRNELASR